TSANFFIPGLMVVLCQMMAVTLSANAIVREKEKGTLEQLFMTPVKPGELVLGKMVPYLVMTFTEFCGIALLMRVVFGVPIQGRFMTVWLIALPFVLSMLGLGLWISTKVSTRDAAMQAAIATIMPCVFLSGYVFPLDSVPRFFYWVAQVIPTTWLIDASRGVILRGAGWRELWLHSVVLWAMTLVVVTITALRFHKRVTGRGGGTTDGGGSLLLARGSRPAARGRTMRKATKSKRDSEMLAEYDFSSGVRGKYTKRYAEGTNV